MLIDGEEVTVLNEGTAGVPFDDPAHTEVAEQMYRAYLSIQEDREKEGLKNLRKLRNKQMPIQYAYKEKYSQYTELKENQAKAKGVEPKDLVDYPVFEYTPEHNYIGERIVFLMNINNQEVADFCRNIDISRSSLHRYIKGTHVPSEKLLEKIIAALFVDVADFSSEPDNFEEWKDSFKRYQGEDIFEFKKENSRTIPNKSFYLHSS
ncbi:MAG: helix-turn-helix transcriptional regulator [Clostridia bacterium]|nr:helix-turn-helix transcriptional regulator [Clostridia bacterium]